MRMTISSRIKAALTTKGISRSELARRVGISPSAVTQILKGSTKSLKGNTLLKIAQTLDVSANWLETGQGEITAPDHLDIDESEMIALWRELVSPNKVALISVARSLRASQIESKQTTVAPYKAPVTSKS